MATNTNIGPINRKEQATMPGGVLSYADIEFPDLRHNLGVTGDITETIETNVVTLTQHEQVGGVKDWFAMNASTKKTLDLTLRAFDERALEVIYGGDVTEQKQVAGAVVSEAGWTDGDSFYALGTTVSSSIGVTDVTDVVVTDVGAKVTYVEDKDYQLLNREDGFAQIRFLPDGKVRVAALAAPLGRVPFEVSYKTTERTIKSIKNNTNKSKAYIFYFDGVDAISSRPLTRIFRGSIAVNGSYTIKSLGEEITEIPLIISVSPDSGGNLGITKFVEPK